MDFAETPSDPKFESDTFSFRYAKTDRLGNIEPSYVIFTINADRTVTLLHVEEIRAYEQRFSLSMRTNRVHWLELREHPPRAKKDRAP